MTSHIGLADVYQNSDTIWKFSINDSDKYVADVPAMLLDKQCSFTSDNEWPVLPFSKLNYIFFGYFDPEKIFLDNENK